MWHRNKMLLPILDSFLAFPLDSNTSYNIHSGLMSDFITGPFVTYHKWAGSIEMPLFQLELEYANKPPNWST